MRSLPFILVDISDTEQVHGQFLLFCIDLGVSHNHQLLSLFFLFPSHTYTYTHSTWQSWKSYKLLALALLSILSQPKKHSKGTTKTHTHNSNKDITNALQNEFAKLSLPAFEGIWKHIAHRTEHIAHLKKGRRRAHDNGCITKPCLLWICHLWAIHNFKEPKQGMNFMAQCKSTLRQ